MRITKPFRLSFGDVVGIIAPASPPPSPAVIDQAVAAVEALGFRPQLGANVRKRSGFLAGTDRQRASDLMRMFANPKVRAIFSLRGGYGCSRLLPLLDFDLIRRNPKILVGYSDISSLHCALWARARLVTFHGPMLNSDLIKPGLPGYTKDTLLRALMSPEPLGEIISRLPKPSKVHALREGTASGRLLGGNLTLVTCAVGTPFEVRFKDAIFFFEELDELPYRVDRMLTQLLNAGALQGVVGIAIGTNRKCEDPKAATTSEYRQTLEDVFRDRLLPLKVPVLSHLPFGHVPLNATLPLGIRATLDARAGNLVIEDSAVV